MLKQWKIIVIGEIFTGKTSILRTISGEPFVDNFRSTIGVDFALVDVEKEGICNRLSFWDVAGNSRFQSVTDVFFRGANFVIIVYDVTNYKSFQGIKKWYQLLENHFSDDLIDIPIIVIANKSDLIEELHENYEELGKEIIEKNMEFAHFIKVSAKTGENIKYIIPNILNMLDACKESKVNKPRVYLESGESTENLIDLMNNNEQKKERICKCLN